MTAKEDEGVFHMQPKTLEQRVTIARDFLERFEYELAWSISWTTAQTGLEGYAFSRSMLSPRPPS